ncbi:MBL fold metallo-hydrolase [Tychonema sp. LEGE 06208]|uniref:MBL fold metallo-hydrolase n=1 Tax=Tychonema sp. LEGE 06208 TaxID=1828663 RepID=UPI0018806252|nr:MBL fold metallo-hydrolase [Tychonema sp. LEGE 06208]MBE9163096.1 MBL fold metallo-hydrolase [Tychonema sp. LEGE 06208]
MKQQSSVSKQPRLVLPNIFAFAPNRDTLGATAYFIVENESNILVDCPPWDEINQTFLEECGGVRLLFLTHRGAMAKAREIQEATGCDILIQEQEAYLLPGLRVTVFEREFTLSDRMKAFWTPGHSPGSSCLYDSGSGGVLFSGRHLLPNREGAPVPIRTAKTFHWPRQINSVKSIVDGFSPSTLQYICPAANTGFLRKKGSIDRAFEQLANLDLAVCLQSKPEP